MKWLVGLLALLMVITGAVLFFAYSGWYDVRATRGHWEPVAWWMQTTVEHSVRRRAEEIDSSPRLVGGEPQVKSGARRYQEYCVGCHGAPGRRRSAAATGMFPEPPRLARGLGPWQPRDLYWIVQHGIKMTGMPAWGETLSKEAIWDVVAFLQKLPEMDAAAYRSMTQGVAHTHSARERHGSDPH